MQNIGYLCKNCNEIFYYENKKLYCKKCNNVVEYKNGHYNFEINNSIEKCSIEKTKIKFLLEEIEKNGYNLSVKNFLKKYSEFKIKFLDPKFDQSVDSIFHCLGKNNEKCLVLGSGFGNKVEILSNIFDQVYSIETMEELLIFQNIKFMEAKIANVILLKSGIKEIPFINNFFDLVIIEESFFDLIKFDSNNQKNSKIIIFEEIKRILNQNGCLCFGLKNYSKYNFLFKNNIIKNKNGVNLSRISKLIKNSGFHTKIFWVLPSIEKPYFSSNIDDGLAIKWYFKNFKNFIKETKNQLKYTIFLKIFSKFSQNIIKILIKKFAPYFIFYCYKENIPNSIENYILKETNFSSCFTISRRIKTVFILLDNLGKAKYIVHFKRFGKDFPNNIPSVERIFPNMANPKNRIWMERWKEGRRLNPLNSNEIIQSLLWLFKFQNNSFQDRFTENELKKEIIMIKENLSKRENLNIIQYNEWIEDYKKFLTKNIIRKSAQHGDFSYANILYNPKTNNINLVDWENYISVGSPFRDFATFIIRIMMQSSTNEVKSFKEKIQNRKEFNDLIKKIQKLLNEHFKCNIDINVIIRYSILKKTADLIFNEKESANTYIELLKILENNNFVKYKEEK